MDNNVLYNQQIGMVPPQGMPQPMYTQQAMTHRETDETKNMKGNFVFFGGVTLLYAVFYVICMFRNDAGVAILPFVVASVVYLNVAVKKLGLVMKKGGVFYVVAMLLLAVSTFCTDDGRIIFFNKTGIFLLALSLMINQFYDTKSWSIGMYFGNIIMTWFASLGEMFQPLTDAANFFKKGNSRRNKNVLYVVLGVVIAVPLVVFVLVMLSSADIVFREVSVSFVSGMDIEAVIEVVFRIAFMFFATYWLISFLCKRTLNTTVKDNRKGEPVLAITVNSMLTAVYLLFSGIQIVYLFMGQMKLPEGYTYAMYAREGFFQLLVVSAMNLVIVLISISWFKESEILKCVLTVMSLCTFVMIASSAYRMIMYIRYYYLTFLRILVLWALALLVVLFVGVIVSIFKKKFPLFRYSMVVVTVFYIALSFSHPDYIIAKVNIENATEIITATDRDNVLSGRGFFLSERRYKDYYYLSSLSADAAPVVIPYLEGLGYDVKAIYENESGEKADYYDDYMEYGTPYGDDFGYLYIENLRYSTENLGIRTYNVSRHKAIRCIEEAAN
ncbi:MAG: DUF4173 domain-containing protein [Lachnospira sp.]|nr:DUF4173 domain-containing protein [Lachnospira sp.]